MKVALVCPYAWDRPGGVQSHIRSLARALETRGHEVLVIAPRSGSIPPEPRLSLVGRSVPIPANGSVAPLAFGPLAARSIGVVLDDFRPDVLHLHEPLIPSLSFLALWRSRTPAVGTFHASATRSAGYQLAKPLLERAAGRLAVRTAVSEAARDLIERYISGRYDLTPNGVDPASFATAEPFDAGDGPKVLFLGRIERRKGLDVLVRAMARLRETGAELLVAGRGPGEKDAHRLAASLQVRARFLGYVDDATKARLFRRADVYCAPARGGESFGIVLLEAMAAGTPVVCSDIAGFRAVAGRAALLTPTGDPAALADAIRRVLDDDEMAARMTRVGSMTADAFSWERLVVNVETVFRTAIEEGTRHADRS
ncbi:MAG TPA: glycosyltransferase family 4 protein [Actinomycetota bacterium]|nr:glycosyltransferase family 4 protein [Actinomycetota bacterium]